MMVSERPSAAFPRLPAKDALAAGGSSQAEAEFFEAGGRVEPIVRRHDDGDRHQARLHPRHQGAEDPAAAMFGSGASVAQIEDFVLGVMSFEHLRIDKNKPDDAFLLVERD